MKVDVLSWMSSASFSVRSTARRLRLTSRRFNPDAWLPVDYVEVGNYFGSSSQFMYATLNGPTTSSSLASGFYSGGQLDFVVPHGTSKGFYTMATSISLMATGASNVAAVVYVGRF